MIPITIEKFAKDFVRNNKGYTIEQITEILQDTVERKKNGAKCHQCGSSIWAIGSAVQGLNGCFTCITLEADDSEDYEIDTVCYR